MSLTRAWALPASRGTWDSPLLPVSLIYGTPCLEISAMANSVSSFKLLLKTHSTHHLAFLNWLFVRPYVTYCLRRFQGVCLPVYQLYAPLLIVILFTSTPCACVLYHQHPATMWSCRSWRRKTSRSCRRKCCCCWTEAVKAQFVAAFMPMPQTALAFPPHVIAIIITSLCPVLCRRPRVYVQTHPAGATLGSQVSAGRVRQRGHSWHLLQHWHDGDDRHRRTTNIWPFTWRQGEMATQFGDDACIKHII